MLESLGYIGIATNLLGMQIADARDSSFSLRTDERAGRLFVERGGREGVNAMGWQVADGDALAQLATRLSNAGHPVRPGTRSEAAQRLIVRLILGRSCMGMSVFLNGKGQRSRHQATP
eukprot:gene34685-46561_t